MTKKSKKPSAPKLFPDELIDQLLAQVQSKDAESILGELGLAGQLKKQLAERMLAAELTHHLEAEAEQGKSGNHRNGTSPKTVITPNGEPPSDSAPTQYAPGDAVTVEPAMLQSGGKRPRTRIACSVWVNSCRVSLFGTQYRKLPTLSAAL